MNDNNQTLKFELKKSLRSINYPVLFGGGVFIAIMSQMLVLAHNPELFDSGLNTQIEYTLKWYGLIVGLVFGGLIFLTFSDYYKPKVMQYVYVPKSIDELRSQMITVASLVTIDFPDNLKKVGNFFSYLNQQLNEFRTHFERHDKQIKSLNDNKANKSELEKVENTVNELKNDYNTLYRFTGKQGQHVFALHWTLQRTLRENSRLVKENNELRKRQERKDDQLLNKITHTQNIDENEKN